MNAANKRNDIEVVGPIPFEDRQRLKTREGRSSCKLYFNRSSPRMCPPVCSVEASLMMEKPLATTNEDAREMAKLSASAKIPIFVNYETTWYKSHAETVHVSSRMKTPAERSARWWRWMAIRSQRERCRHGISRLVTDPVRNGRWRSVRFWLLRS